VENTICGILLVKCYIDHRPLAVKPFATSGVTLAFLVLYQGLTILGSDAKKSQQCHQWNRKKLSDPQNEHMLVKQSRSAL